MKKFKLIVGAVALFALVVANVWNAATTLTGSDLNIADVEAMANPEGMDDVGGYPKEHGTKTKRDCVLQVEYIEYVCGTVCKKGEYHACQIWGEYGWPRYCYVRRKFTEPTPGKEVDCPWDPEKTCRRQSCHEVGPFGL